MTDDLRDLGEDDKTYTRYLFKQVGSWFCWGLSTLNQISIRSDLGEMAVEDASADHASLCDWTVDLFSGGLHCQGGADTVACRGAPLCNEKRFLRASGRNGVDCRCPLQIHCSPLGKKCIACIEAIRGRDRREGHVL